MDLSQEQIEQEFTRQVRLCRGIGQSAMLRIIEAEFGASSANTVDDLRAQLQRAKERDFADADADAARRACEAERDAWRQNHLGRGKRGRR